MKMIEQPCKICGRPALAKFDDDAPQESVDAFLPMLVHDKCGDLHRKYRDSEEHIVNYALNLARGKCTPELIAKTKTAISLLSRRFAEAVCEVEHAPEVIWSEDFTDLIMNSPDKVGTIIHQYKNEVRRTAAEARRAA